LEAAWRGLKFLVDRIEFRVQISLEILSTTRDTLLEDFYEKVFKVEYDGLAEDPLTLVVADFAIDRGPSDLEMLQDAARMASSLRVPFVFAGAPEFFGVRQPGLLATLPDLVQKMRSQEYAKWNRFRQQESALWVADCQPGAAPRCLGIAGCPGSRVCLGYPCGRARRATAVGFRRVGPGRGRGAGLRCRGAALPARRGSASRATREPSATAVPGRQE
jgi:hypothetical protein